MEAVPAPQAAPQGQGAAASGSATQKKGGDRDKVQAKLDFCNALAHMGMTQYEKAAQIFLRLGYKGLDDWYGKVSRSCMLHLQSSN